MPDVPLPPPPRLLRQGPLRAGAFPSRLHDERTAALLGRALGIAFATCFVTGLISHGFQVGSGALSFAPALPVWGYRLNQGIHVATGLAAIPLLLAKLWTVYPRLWQWPPLRSLGHAGERLSLGVLVAGALFQLYTGLVNITQWYPWGFAFKDTHYWVSWVTIGALLLHLAYKAPAIARGLRLRGAEPPRPLVDEDVREPAAMASGAASEPASEPEPGGLTRRGLLTAVGAGVGLVTITTVGQTLRPAERLAVLAPRLPSIGPQGFPVNRTAQAAGVMQRAMDPAYALQVLGPQPYEMRLDELAALPSYEVELPITCVAGWSATARWRGVRVRDLLDRAGIPADASVRVTSLEEGPYAVSVLAPPHARDGLTLLALGVNGEPLALDHGFPARLIAPNRPGVLQTKWVTRLEVMA